MDKKEARIVFLGTPEIAAAGLEALIEDGYNIVGVVSQPDTPKKRSRTPTPSPVSEVALKHGIPLHRPERLNKDFGFVTDLHPDLLLTYAYGQILSTKVLALSASFAPVNVHASDLPLLRGASPIQTAILQGMDKTAVCLMEMVKAMDAGRVFARLGVDIAPTDDFTALNRKISEAAIELLKEYLPLYLEGKLLGVAQDESKATFCHMFDKKDEYLDFYGTPATDLINTIRAFSLTPGAWFELEDGTRLKVFSAQFVEQEGTEKGRIITASHKELKIGCQGGSLRLLSLQKEGKKIMDVASFLNGTRDLEGKRVKSVKEVFPTAE